MTTRLPIVVGADEARFTYNDALKADVKANVRVAPVVDLSPPPGSLPRRGRCGQDPHRPTSRLDPGALPRRVSAPADRRRSGRVRPTARSRPSRRLARSGAHRL